MTEPLGNSTTRRGLIAGGVGLGIAGVLAACSGGSPEPTPSGTRTSGGASGARRCPAASGAADAGVRAGQLGRPGRNEPARCSGPDRPAGTPRARSATPGTTTPIRWRSCAWRSTRTSSRASPSPGTPLTPVALRAGGHSYTGWSAGGAAGTGVPRSLVVSTAGLDSIELSRRIGHRRSRSTTPDVYERPSPAPAGRSVRLVRDRRHRRPHAGRRARGAGPRVRPHLRPVDPSDARHRGRHRTRCPSRTSRTCSGPAGAAAAGRSASSPR